MNGPRSLFLLSFQDRDPLAAVISTYGWRVSSARRANGLRQRFLSSRALLAVLDIRHSEQEGLEAIEKLASLSEKGGVRHISTSGSAQYGGALL